MASSSQAIAFDDVLSYLPVSAVTECRKREILYSLERPSMNLYLVVAGRIELSQIGDDGESVLLEIIRPDEVFGQSGFLTSPPPSEQAIALEASRYMSWPIATIEDLVTKRPRLAVALLQILAQRTADFARRIEILSTDNVERRLIRSLLHFAQRLGVLEGDGSVHMDSLTHETLARHVGTSREVVTQYMNQFRKRGYLTYSRREMVLDFNALLASIAKKAASPRAMAPGLGWASRAQRNSAAMSRM